MSWVRIWIHLVFCTKNRSPFLRTKKIRLEMFQHIKENAQAKDIWLDCISGYKEHAHCLLSLGREQSISKVAQLIKGESSFWINRNGLINHKFIWQDDYWAIGVSESHLESVRKYIQSQEEHHKRVSFTDEIDEFIKKYDWEKFRE